ncbi:hypothetical protein D3C76_1357300 [compost metagenome]
MPPLAGKQQQAGQQGAEKQLRAEIAQPGHQYHGAVDGLAAMFLHQGHHALVEFVQVRPAEEYPGQGHEAHAGDQSRAMALVTNAGGQAKADDDCQGAGDDACIQPEAFRQRQAHGRAGGPAGQQVGDRPAGAGHQAYRDETR